MGLGQEKRFESVFEEVRRHLGIETQRQWAPLAIAHTTPLLLALFSLVCLIVQPLRPCWASLPRSTAWYLKSQATFSDLLEFAPRASRAEANFVKSTMCDDRVIISRQYWERVHTQPASTA